MMTGMKIHWSLQVFVIFVINDGRWLRMVAASHCDIEVCQQDQERETLPAIINNHKRLVWW